MFHCNWDSVICLKNIFWNINRLLNCKNYLKHNGVCKIIIKMLKCHFFFLFLGNMLHFFTYTQKIKTWKFPGRLESPIVLFTYVWITHTHTHTHTHKVHFILCKPLNSKISCENFDELIFCRQFWSNFWFSNLDFGRQFRKFF